MARPTFLSRLDAFGRFLVNAPPRQSELSMSTFAAGDRVVYIPKHANGDRNHKDCEAGKVSLVRKPADEVIVFVKFDRAIALYGEEHVVGQSCYPADLVHE